MFSSGSIAVGIVGVSHYHALDWVNAIVTDPTANLVGVWDADPERAAVFEERAQAPQYSSLDDLLARCDLVLIAAVTTDHASLVERAAEHGCHILLEKPTAANRDDLARIRVAVESAGIVFAQNFPKRLDPATVRLRSLIREGELGNLAMVRMRHGHSQGFDPSFRSSWFTDAAQAGGGALLDEGIHLLDLCLDLFGRPSSISASISSRATGLPVEDTAIITLEYADGPMVSICASWAFAGADGSIEVHGDRASVSLGGVDMASRGLSSGPLLRICDRLPTALSAERHWRDLDTTPVFTSGGFHELGVRDMLDALRDGRRPAAGLQEAEDALELVLSAYDSAHTRSSICL